MSATATEMDADEIAAFLDGQETGVLSLANADEGYGIPVSFAFEGSDETADGEGASVYFRLGYAPGSRKRTFVDASDHVSFTVYGDTDEGWKSVVARGPLEAVSSRSLDALLAESIQQLDIPYFSVHGSPMNELHFTLTRLNVAELTGIVEGSTER
jgi:hypothetical protein